MFLPLLTSKGSDSLDYPLLGFGPPSRYFPLFPPTVLRPGAPLLGFLVPSAHQEEGVHGPTSCPAGHPRLYRDSADGSHPAGYGVAPRFSQPLGDLLPPSAALPFSDRWRSWDSLFRGSCLPRSPAGSSPPACPLDVSPAGRATPVLGRGASRHARRYLGWPGVAPFRRLQGVHLRGNRSASPRHI